MFFLTSSKLDISDDVDVDADVDDSKDLFRDTLSEIYMFDSFDTRKRIIYEQPCTSGCAACLASN